MDPRKDERGYRIFVSYARIDLPIARALVKKLREKGHDVYWDRDISAGSPFSDTIKGFISQAHVLVALLSEDSRNRPWVHQETGFAVALEIPVLVVAAATGEGPGAKTGEAENDLGMIGSLQRITVKPDLTDFDERWEEVDLPRLVTPPPPMPASLNEIAEWPEERTRLLVQHANRQLQLGRFGRIRQKAAYSPAPPSLDARFSDSLQ